MSMRRSVYQIRSTHTGSLRRPPDMLETLHQLAAGHSIDLAAYESANAARRRHRQTTG